MTTILSAAPDRMLRPLRPDDLERVIAIDSAHVGRTRRDFFAKRLEAARAHPEDFIHFAVTDRGSLVGFAIARLLHGEFGRTDAAAVLDAVGVEPESRAQGVGTALMDGLADLLRRKGVRLLQSQAEWTHHGLLRFFAASGFVLAPRLVLERPLAETLPEPVDDDQEAASLR